MASIYKRGKVWAAAVSYKTNDKYTRKVKSGFSTKTEAQKWAISIEEQKNRGGLSNDNLLFVDEYIKWYEVFKEPKLSWQSKNWFKICIRLITEEWGNKKINQVKASDFQKLINTYSKGHVKSSVVRIKTMISAFVRYAVDEDLIHKDFTRNVHVIAGKQSKPVDTKFLENDEIDRLIKRSKESRSVSSLMILTGIYTGLRYAEIAGLTNDDIDLDNNIIHVTKSWDTVEHQFKTTKTENSVRDVSIPSDLHDIFSQMTYGDRFVFQTRNGFPPSNNTCNTMLSIFLKKDNSKIVTMHGLRHSHASYLISNDVSVHYVSERLGHANVNITLGIYSHLLEEKREADNSKTLDLLNSLNNTKP
ncbi:site-specific integrase [Fructobacillus sp. M2-14]|uniref:Site-specific integrase n=1 Tax=Fructobacillus broussonetiae TaxID=2713173 RepID=A0ABS5QYS9_9LACO|nr:site-specific integrase [Fructobacillus broussonetiae]MBS9338350.1 site-specific integrase [Fructobacillus broussonetiae]